MVELTDQNFAAEVENAKGVVLVDFWAPWCGPCQILGPRVEEIAAKQTTVKFGKMLVDDNPVTSEKYRIFSIPTIKIFKDGREVDESVGLVEKAVLEEKLQKVK